jgi:hypothetical protein
VESKSFLVARDLLVTLALIFQSVKKRENSLFTNLIHLIPILISNAVVNPLEMNTRQEFSHGILSPRLKTIPRQESTMILAALNKSMRRLTISLNSSDLDSSTLILKGTRLRDRLGAILNGSIINSIDIVNLEGNVLHGVAMLLKVGVNLTQLRLLLGAETVDLVQGA